MTEALLAFWFGPLDAAGLCTKSRRRTLFRADPAFDAALAERFGADVEAALAGDRNNWAHNARGRAALVLLLDQLPRNLFRGTPRAFAGDARALAHARAAVEAGDDRALPTEMRAFLYMPFEHAEDSDAQREGVALLTALHDEQLEDSPARAAVASYLPHAQNHAALVTRFGRFPHRNAVLGRASTPEERTHLAADDRTFGQA